MQIALSQIGAGNTVDWRALHLSAGGLELKFAETPTELESVIRLRSAIFGSEYGAQVDCANPLWDFDEIDERARHLLVIDPSSRTTVGTYRLLLSDGSSGFYSQTEFDLSGFLRKPGLKLELSRACIHPAYRTGAVLLLLWKGLLQSARASGASVLFGCSSVKSENEHQVQQLMAALQAEGHVDDRHEIRPLPQFRMHSTTHSRPNLESLEVPPLLRMYLKAGAYVAPVPAHDRIFRCVDFLTILELDRLEDTMARRLERITAR